MRSNFPAAYALTRKDEGGDVDDPKDRGGRTSRGVTQRTYDAYRAKHNLSRRDVYLMDDQECRDIYLSGYWLPVGGDNLPIGPDYAAYDYGVNSGPARAKKAIPEVPTMPADAMVRAICANRTSFVNGIRDFAKFRKGVLARVARVEVAGVKMALGAAQATDTHVKMVFDVQAKAADKKALSASTKATAGSAVTLPAGVGTTAAGAGNNSSATVILVLAGIAVVAAAVAFYFAYHASRERARADAYKSA